MISAEVTDKIRADHRRLIEEVQRLKELAEQRNDAQLLACARALQRLVGVHVLLVDGVLEAVHPDGEC